MKTVLYKTVTAKTAVELDKQVNQLLEAGYQPYGNPYLIDRQGEETLGEFLLFQAMVMDQDEKDALESEAERVLRGGRVMKKG